MTYATALDPDHPHKYNATRLHGSLGDMPPIEYETLHYAQHQPSQPVGATP